MLLSLAFGMVASGGWLWQSLRGTQSFCEQAVLEMRDKIDRRKQMEEEAMAEKQRAARVAERVRNDADAQAERMKWTRVIEATPFAMPSEIAESNEPLFEIASDQPSSEMTQEDTPFWSFQRLARGQPPSVAERSWCRNPIDAFILARLEAAGLSPNPSAQRQVLARRLWFDLIGMPPQPDEIDAFVATSESQAYEQLVDRLLRNPAFGERWGRMWLDLARYADSNGYEEDELRPHAFPYRDFVIWAMNVDLPFDRFTRWQIAGDELAGTSPDRLPDTNGSRCQRRR